jgi:hypothetical protein
MFGMLLLGLLSAGCTDYLPSTHLLCSHVPLLLFSFYLFLLLVYNLIVVDLFMFFGIPLLCSNSIIQSIALVSNFINIIFFILLAAMHVK